MISGTPTTAGTTTVTITYTDDDGDTDTAEFDIVVGAAQALAATANSSFEVDFSAEAAASLGDAPALEATANASFEVDFSAAAVATLGDAPSLEATANASFEVDFSAAAPASLGDAPVHQPLAAVGNASFEVDFSASAPAALGTAVSALLELSDFVAPAGTEIASSGLFTAGVPTNSGGVERLWGRSPRTAWGTLTDGDFEFDGVSINEIRRAANGSNFRLLKNGGTGFNSYFATDAGGEDARFYILTAEITIDFDAVANILSPSGGNFFNFTLPRQRGLAQAH